MRSLFLSAAIRFFGPKGTKVIVSEPAFLDGWYHVDATNGINGVSVMFNNQRAYYELTKVPCEWGDGPDYRCYTLPQTVSRVVAILKGK